MLPVLQIGPLAIQFPGLVLILGIWLGLTISERTAEKFNVSDSHIYNLVFLNLFVGLIGARVSYIATHFYAFEGNIRNIFSLNPGLLDFGGGAGFALIASVIYIQRNKLKIWPLLDALTPFLNIAQIAVALSVLASGKVYGRPTTLPWGIELWNQIRHPNQIYYALAGLIVLGVLLKIVIPKMYIFPGMTFFLFTSMISFAYLTLNIFDATGATIFGRVSVLQLSAWFVLAISLIVIRFRIQNKAFSDPQ